MEQVSVKPLFKRVLLIDDNEADRFIAQYLFGKSNFCEDLILEESAGSALDYLRSLSRHPETWPELIFLDIRMPGMDGFEFLEEFKSLSPEFIRYCTIIMLSTSLDPDDHRRARENPLVLQFINKPFDKEKVEELRRDLKR